MPKLHKGSSSKQIVFWPLEKVLFQSARDIATSKWFSSTAYTANVTDSGSSLSSTADPIWHYIRNGSTQGLQAGDGEEESLYISGLLLLSLLCPFDAKTDLKDIKAEDIAAYNAYIETIEPWLSQGLGHDVYELITTARLDIINSGTEKNTVEILSSSDDNLKKTYPAYLTKKDGKGCVLSSSARSLSVELKCVEAGNLSLKFKGMAIQDGQGARIPLWIAYSGFSLKGGSVDHAEEESFRAWHDAIHQYSLPVTDADTLTLNASWRVCPQTRSTIYALLCHVDSRLQSLERYL